MVSVLRLVFEEYWVWKAHQAASFLVASEMHGRLTVLEWQVAMKKCPVETGVLPSDGQAC